MAQPPPYSASYPAGTSANPPPPVAYPAQPMAYPAPPMAPSAGGPPPAYAQPQHQTTVVVQQTPAAQPKPKKSGGMFSSFMKEVDKFGKQLGKEVDYCSNKINEAVDKNMSTNLTGLFASNNVVQLLPRSTGRTVQILLDAQNHMFLDGNGDLNPNLFNSLWTVKNEGNNQVRLQNNNNFLAVINGFATIVPIVPGVTLGPETKFQISQINQQFMSLESMAVRNKFVGFYSTGQIKPAGPRDFDCHFSVKLVATGYPIVNPPK